MIEVQANLGEFLKNEGMDAAVINANRHCNKWSERAYNVLIYFLTKSTTDTFMTEDLRAFAVDMGLEEPPSKRAWGSIIVKAKKEGLIEFMGYDQVNNPRAHKANAARWQAVRYIKNE